MTRPGEFALIDHFVAAFPKARRPVVLGPGDDAALLAPRPGHVLALTVDELIEGVHFSGAFRPEDVGHKALAVNLSDLAAMGGRPVAFLCALALTPARIPDLGRIARGMAALARVHGCVLAGGNLSRARALSVCVTAVGEVPEGRALRRDGARPGDLLVVSGRLGGAAAALREIAAGKRRRALWLRQLRPAPRVALGLVARDRASAAIDVSDGLVQDLRHLLDASGVGARVDVARIPVEPGASLDDALSGGEDYELLLAVSPARLAGLERAARRAGTPISVIGEIERRRGLKLEGLRSHHALRGYDHFR